MEKLPIWRRYRKAFTEDTKVLRVGTVHICTFFENWPFLAKIRVFLNLVQRMFRFGLLYAMHK